jgi:hypothetical protein
MVYLTLKGLINHHLCPNFNHLTVTVTLRFKGIIIYNYILLKIPRIQTIYNQLAFVRFVQYASPLFLTAYAYTSYQKKKHIQKT